VELHWERERRSTAGGKKIFTKGKEESVNRKRDCFDWAHGPFQVCSGAVTGRGRVELLNVGGRKIR